jgi:acyl-CoA synthetase (AMP-forming)/AMP-acid ligase II
MQLDIRERASLNSLTLAAHSSARHVSDVNTRVCLDDLHRFSSIENSGDLHGRSVLIKTTRQLATVLAIIELDGVARRILLWPPDQAADLSSVVRAAGVDRILTDDIGPAYENLPVVQGKCVLEHARWNAHRSIQTEWILFTSGTTGQPKMAIHTLSSLTGPLDDGLTGDAGAVWSTFYDIRRYGGLQILLRSLWGGGSMVLSGQDESTSELLVRLGKAGITHISGTPSHWRRVLMSPSANAISPKYVRLSGEIVDQTILDNLHRVYPDASIAHAFASTEAGVAFDVRDRKAGFPASVIEEPNGRAETRVFDGTLHIRSCRTASGYISGELAGFDGFVDTGDLVQKRGDRYYFVGRKEGVINVGGQKVFPEEVEAVIVQHPAVRVARVWARQSPIVGAVVAADVVLRPDSAMNFAEVRTEVLQHCHSRLARWKVPATVRQVDAILLNPSGKIARHGA